MNKPLWPIRTRFKEDELLSSWIIRTSLENGSDPMTWTWFYWGKWRPWTIDIDRFCPRDKLQKISSPIFTINTLEEATLAPTIIKILGEEPPLKQAWPWITRQGSRNRERTGGLRFCPECLKEESYFRKSWRFAWNHSCPKHRVLLQEFCPSCSSPLTPHKADFEHSELYLCKRCGLNFTEIKSEASLEYTIQIQTILNKAIRSKSIPFPWNIDSITELFLSIRYLYIFFNLASKGHTNSDKAICGALGVKSTVRPTEYKIESIEKAPPIWIRELDKCVSQLLILNDSEIADLFSRHGVTQESFSKNKTIPSEFIKDILHRLPRNKRHRTSSSRKSTEIKPKTKEEVWTMWLVLQEYLK